MSFKNLLSACLLASLTSISLSVNAANINVNVARQTASDFLKVHAVTTPGSFKAPSMNDLRLAFTESSSVDHNANAYYAFNINGGGFIIIAGEDRANQVLGYSDNGHLDFNNLPDNFKALLNSYQEEIEYLQSHPELKVAPAVQTARGTGIEPLIKTNWGQEMPYYLQCPIYQGEYCVVGCVATAMAQVMYYWRYPTSCNGIGSYYCYDIGQTVPALPSTTFDYSLMLPSYCHWDWDNSVLVQDAYTDEQAQEVAKLSRYCGQAVSMGYSPEGSGAYTFSQLSAMKSFGFSNSATDVERSGWWNDSYSDAEWEAMIKEELDKRQPILYSASDPAAGGHAFICDGYNAEGLFHFNFGWYGTCDGWYVSTALNMTHRDGDVLHFNSGHEMLLGVVPPSYCLISTDGIQATNDLLILGDNLDIQADNVNIMTTDNNLSLIFALFNDSGRKVSTSSPLNVTTADFEQGSNVNLSMALPTTLETGTYTVEFHYYIAAESARMSTPIDCESGVLNVVGHLAKFNSRFTIDDVTATIDSLLNGSHPVLNIDDVTELIDYLLKNN
jgi:hypothetical protein